MTARRCWRPICLIFPATFMVAEMCVEFVARIRDELKFDSLDALKAEMARDIERARAILAARRRSL